MPKRCFLLALGNVSGRGIHTLHDNAITVSDGFFVFPAKTLAYTESVSFGRESSYNDVFFKYTLSLKDIAAGARLGIQVKSRTDNFNGENVTFMLTDGFIRVYTNNTLRQTFDAFNLQSLEGQTVEMVVRRQNDRYFFYFNGQTYEIRFTIDGTVYRQNVVGAVYGSGISVRVDTVCNITELIPVKFALLGDSIASGYAAGPYEGTIAGINKLERGLSFEEFAGSANVIKDGLDGLTEIAAVRPKYGIVMYGHNDLYFNTGRLVSDYRKLIDALRNYGIIPIICTMPASTWITLATLNNFIRANYFNDRFLHLDLEPVLTYPADYRDGAHPNTAGNRKLADAIYNFIKDLE